VAHGQNDTGARNSGTVCSIDCGACAAEAHVPSDTSIVTLGYSARFQCCSVITACTALGHSGQDACKFMLGGAGQSSLLRALCKVELQG
jgi:hypothetical protein